MDKVPNIQELLVLDSAAQLARKELDRCQENAIAGLGMMQDFHPLRGQEEAFFLSFFSPEGGRLRPELQELYDDYKGTNARDFRDITEAVEQHAKAKAAFSDGVKKFQAANPGVDVYAKIAKHRPAAAPAPLPTMRRPQTSAPAPAAPTTPPAAPAPQSSATTTPAAQAPEPPKPSLDHPTHPPQKPPQEPSLGQRIREGWNQRFGRNKPAKPAVASASDKEGWLNRLRSAVRREKPAVSMPSSSFSISEAAGSASLSTGGKVALGVGIAAVGGWAIYEATRKDTRKEASPYQGH